jgi:hypothetical protein
MGCALMPALVFAGQPFPLPGLYRVDTVSTQSATAGGVTAAQTTAVQGASGDTAATQRVTGHAPVAAGTYAGKAAVTVCVKPSSDASMAAATMASAMPGGCKPASPQPKIEGDTASFVLQCPTLDQDLQSRRIDNRTWEWRITTRFKNTGAATMPPATAAAMAPVIAQMEDKLRKTPPGPEAEGLRQSLNALRGQNNASAMPSGSANTSVQRYTKLADTCS